MRAEDVVTSSELEESKDIQDQDLLNEIIMEVNDVKQYYCEICEFQDSQFVLFKRHVRDHHPEHYTAFLTKRNLLYTHECEFCNK